MFLDTSLEEMGIRTMTGHDARASAKSTACWAISPARSRAYWRRPAPWVRDSTSPWPARCCIRTSSFPVTIGDGGMGEPYVLNCMMHFHTAYPKVTNFLPALIWNGYSQEHHSMVSRLTNEEMIAYWRGHGFEEVVLVDAKDFDDRTRRPPMSTAAVSRRASAWPSPKRCWRGRAGRGQRLRR